jgi:WD40 repeat protein
VISNIYGDVFEPERQLVKKQRFSCGSIFFRNPIKSKTVSVDLIAKPFISAMCFAPVIDSLFMTDNLGKLKQFIFKPNCQIAVRIFVFNSKRDFGKIHLDLVVSLCTSSDGKFLYTCSVDGLVKKICLDTPNRVSVKNMWGNDSRVNTKILCMDCTIPALIKYPRVFSQVTRNNVMVMSSDDAYLWVGTGKGSIVRIKTQNFESREFKGNFGTITSILINNDNDLFIGNKEGDFHLISGEILYSDLPKSSLKKKLYEVWDTITKSISYETKKI